MKKIVFLLLALGITTLLSAQTMTVYISGHVTDDSLNLPVVNHAVYINGDSVMPNGYFSIRYTDVNGFYADTIENVPQQGYGIPFLIYTESCNQLIDTTVWSINSPCQVDFTICTGQNPGGCQAMFTYYTDSTGTTTVYFIDQSIGNPAGPPINSWLWSFGDGTSSTEQNPVHIYQSQGTYMVCLTISNGDSTCTDTYCSTISVGINIPCQASFLIYPDSSNTSGTYHFIDTSTGNPSVWFWSFGDGSTSYQQNPVHTYQSPGLYLVCLTISDSLNLCTSTSCDSLFVGGNPGNCTCRFDATTTGLTVDFEGFTSGIDPTMYTWIFPDGTIQFGQQITYTFIAAGYYTVLLTAVNADSCTSYYTGTVVVQGGSTNDIWGQVIMANSFADEAMVVLFSQTQGTVNFIAEDTCYVDSAGHYFFANLPAGTYYLLAELLPLSVAYGQYIPTYYESAAIWQNAIPVVVGQITNPYNIILLPVFGTTYGSGNITGFIGTKLKAFGSGTPIAGAEIMLLDESDRILAFDVSDENGTFSFESIALGSYTVHPEMIGKTTVDADLTLSPSNSSISLTYVVSGSNVFMSLEPAPASQEVAVSKVFPNPPVNEAAVSIRVPEARTINLMVINQVGQVVTSANADMQKGTTTVRWDVSGDPGGLYFIKISSPDGLSIIRKYSIIR